MKNKNINIASILTVVPFILVALMSLINTQVNFGTDKGITVFILYLFVICQIVSVIIVGKELFIKKTNDGWFILLANILVILFASWLIGFSNIQG